MGGRSRIEAIHSFAIEGEGIDGNIGQNFTPDSPVTTWKVTGYTQTVDIDNKRMRTDQIRTAQFAYAGASPVHETLSVERDVAWNTTEGQAAPRLSEMAARDRQLELLRHPLTIMRAALDAEAQPSGSREQGNKQILDISTPEGQVTLAVDKKTHLPVSVTTVTDQPNMGDVMVETTFSDYQDVAGLKLPTRLTTKMDRWLLSDIRVARYTLNPNTANAGVPASMKEQAPAPAVPPASVTVENLARGVWLLGGSGNHHSVAFEFADHLTLFELPESEARAEAVIEKAHSLKFGKPLTEVIFSHHHFDHSAGLRLAVVNGLTIITERANISFFKELLTRKHLIVPDQLTKTLAPQRTQFKPVDDQLVLKDDLMEVDLFHVKDNSHSDTLVMGWLPKEKLLVQADLYDSGWLHQPWGDNLLKNVELRKLSPEKDVPVHGAVQPWGEVVATIRKAEK